MPTAPRASTRIIGVDPGLNVTGYGVIDCCGPEIILIEAGVVRSLRSHHDNLPARLEVLFSGLRELMEEFHPQAMCLEEIYTHAAYPQTSILMGHARGVICLAAEMTGVPVVSLAAKRIKQSVTGNGNASKTQVQRAVQHYFALDHTPHPPDVADALAAALCYVNWSRHAGNGARRALRR